MKLKGLGEARRLFRARRFADVIRLLEPEVFRYRENVEYFQMLGFSCLQAGDFGGAFSYISRAHQLKDDDTGVILGLAAVHFRKAENDSALKRWLEVLEIHPTNPIARRGLELLRKGMTPDALQEYVDSGRLKGLFPPLPRRVALAPIMIVGLSILVLAALVILGVRLAGPRGPQRPGVSVIEIPSTLSSFIDVGTDFPFVLTEREVRQGFQKAKNELLVYRDNLAVVDINRILLSNAAPAVKERARMLKGFVTPATFDTVKDTYAYAAVTKQPALYDGASVVWRGKVANLKVAKDSIAFDLLVGYDQEKQLEGIVPVTVPFAADLANGSAVEVLGQVVLNGTAPGLLAVSLHRLAQ
jgi:tetratricopeptide (TPR) repeat protein